MQMIFTLLYGLKYCYLKRKVFKQIYSIHWWNPKGTTTPRQSEAVVDIHRRFGTGVLPLPTDFFLEWTYS